MIRSFNSFVLTAGVSSFALLAYMLIRNENLLKQRQQELEIQLGAKKLLTEKKANV